MQLNPFSAREYMDNRNCHILIAYQLSFFSKWSLLIGHDVRATSPDWHLSRSAQAMSLSEPKWFPPERWCTFVGIASLLNHSPYEILINLIVTLREAHQNHVIRSEITAFDCRQQQRWFYGRRHFWHHTWAYIEQTQVKLKPTTCPQPTSWIEWRFIHKTPETHLLLRWRK